LIAVSSCYSDAPDSGDNTSGGDTPVAAEFSITYTLNDGSWAESFTAPTSFKKADAVTLPVAADVTRTGYTFGGWYTDSEFTDGNEITGWAAGEKTAAVTVYAKWTVNIVTITVSAPTYSGKTLSLASETSGTTTTFTVDSGYESYNWYYDGTLYSSTGNTWALDRSGSSPKVTTGSHQILVIVKETGMSNSYSATCTYTYKVSE